MPLNQSFSPVIECPICGGLHKLANRTPGEIILDCRAKLIKARNRQEIHRRRSRGC
jgi:hypothetical protein